MRIEMRPYQLDAIASVRVAALAGKKRVIVNSPTGTGKTCVGLSMCLSAVRKGNRAVWLAHLDMLIEQPYRMARAFGFAESEIGVVKAERDECDRPFVIACTPTLWREERRNRLFAAGDPFRFVVADECFPGWTLVDGKRIDSIRVGDRVRSWSTKNGIAAGQVSHVFKSVPKSLVSVSAGDTTVACTLNHPFLTQRGWVSAKYLTSLDMVLCFTRNQNTTYFEANHEAKHMRPLRAGNREETTTHKRQDALLCLQRETAIARFHGLQRMREPYRACRQESVRGKKPGASILQHEVLVGPLFKERVGNNGKNKPQVRIGKDEKKQPNATSGNKGKSKDNSSRNGMEAADTRRQWKASPGSTDASCVRSWMANRGFSTMWERVHGERTPELLQNRHCEFGTESSNRGGRAIAFRDGPQGTGPTQRGLPEWARVDGVKVLEPSRDGTFGGLCPDGFVYNLEVESDHTYIANGFVVHNCHHFSSKSNALLLDSFPGDPFVLGLTATVERADRGNLKAVFPGDIVYQLPLMTAIRDGYLVPFTPLPVDVPGLDLTEVGLNSDGDDFNQEELADAFEEGLDALTKATAESWLAHCQGRTTVVFCVFVRQAVAARDALRSVGAKAEMISGETPTDERLAILAGLANGDIDIVTNCMVLTEGVDVPPVDALIMARATKSKSLYLQCLGRGLRPFTDKKTGRVKADCLVVDLVGNTGAHTPYQAAKLLEDMQPGNGESVDPSAPCSCECPACAEHGDCNRCLRKPGCTAAGCRCHARAVRVLVAKRTWVNWVPVGSAIAASGPDRVLVVAYPASGGLWSVDIWRDRVREPLIEAAPEEFAQGVADDAARRLEAKALMKRTADWRANPASEKMIAALAKWKVNPQNLSTLTAGEASDLMTQAITRARMRSIGMGSVTTERDARGSSLPRLP